MDKYNHNMDRLQIRAYWMYDSKHIHFNKPVSVGKLRLLLNTPSIKFNKCISMYITRSTLEFSQNE